MTDYRKKLKRVLDPKKEKFFKKNRIYKISESTNNLESKNLETESLINSMHKFENTFRPECIAKDPSTFSFYGSAERYYDSAFYNIANYYPFDGTNKQLIDWYLQASPLEFSLLKDHWPGTTGHVKFDNSQYINFYGGPQTLDSFENVGLFRDNETPLRLDAVKGNTIEFWLKKSTFSTSNPQEVVFEVGTYPGQIASQYSGNFRLYLSASSGSPFYVDYTSGSVGVTAKNLLSTLTTSSMVDNKWHHYALSVQRKNDNLKFKLYIDGSFDKETSQSVDFMGPVDTFMAGTIGTNNASTDGSLSGSLDEFRFWKGFRDAKDIGKYFDKRVYASDISNTDYTSRLGVYYRFNKDPLGVNSKDKIIVDFSGNQVLGEVGNYSAAFRDPESAITVSDKTQNIELLDPILNLENSKLITKIFEFEELGKSYDNQNINMLSKNVPEWVHDSNREGSANQESEVALLLHLMSTEFDLTKINLDSILRNLGPQNLEPSGLVEDVGTSPTDNTRYIQEESLTCNDNLILDRVTPGNLIDMSLLEIEGSNIEVESLPLIAATIEEENENLIFPFRLEKSIPEIRRAILSNIESTLASMLQRKGTESAFDSVLRSYGVDRDIISYNILGRNTDILISDTKLDLISEKKNSVFLGNNPSATIFLSGTQSDERTFIQSSNEETDYTFEGTFIFPSNVNVTSNVSESSIFGLAEVPASNNSFQFQSPNNADFQVKATKLSLDSDDAKFSLSSDSSIISTLETPIFKDVYKNSRWNLSLRVEKDLDNKFISSSNPSSLQYKVVFSGYNYILDSLQNSFVLSASLNNTKYANFNSANKTFYLGAQRTNITGAVQTKSDIKIVNFSAWNDELSDKEIKFKAQAPSVSGRSSHFLRKDNFNSKKTSMSENLIAELQFANITDLSETNDIRILDASSGSAKHISKYGQIIGYKYPAKSTVFSNETGSVIQQEFLPVVRSVPLINVHGTQGVTIKDSEIDRFSLSSRPESKVFSFEKSMYQAVSREMLLFLSGLESFNNLIGEPINKYRKNYKMIDHLRQKFYEIVENESQFERYVQYYRWIDASIGGFLRQLVPATSDANTGIENVVESHALERSKYQHKYINMEQKVPDLSTNLLAINELLYDWEHGHFDPSELNHCLWQKDRKERIGNRETLRKVLTTKVSGSTYVLRNLVKPYKNSVDIQKNLSIGSNKNANTIPNLYKIINQGKNIVINSEDVYEFKGCNDIIIPNKKKRYAAKTNTTLTSGYIDADSDLILPFSLYSSSAGTTFENFKQNLVITNNHDDIPSLQSSFVQKFVGGYPHRNVEIGTISSERPEAYQIESTNSSLTIKQTTGPKSMFLRSIGGDRFYHIGNIKTQTDPLVIGNYRKDYEIVLTNSRIANNNYLVENEGRNLTSSFTSSSLVSGMVDFFVPERPARDHVIVNRFSSPGSPESNSAYGRDRASGEFSVYNTVNYRNLTIRSVFNTLNVEKSNQFGLRSGSSTQASIHKTNRNPLRFTSSLGKEIIFDNAFVQHQIPQNDFGYSWITASANEKVYSFLKKHGNVGHQHKFKISGSLQSSETINFVSASELVPNLNFARGNFYVTAAVDSENNLITYTNTALNSQLLNNHGPYGWPSWRQIRSLYNPIIRKHRKSNTISAVFTGKKPFTSVKKSAVFDYQNSFVNDSNIFVPRTTKNFKEIMVTSKFKPMVVSVHPVASQAAVELLREIPFRNTLSDIDIFDQSQMEEMWNNDQFYQNILSDQIQDGVTEGERRMLIGGQNGISATPVFSMKTSVQSKISDFANQEMSDEFNHEENEFLEHKNLQILNKFISDTQGFAPIREMNYMETIYPKETNTYTKNARIRENFKFFGWDSSRVNRNLILSGNVTYQDFIYKTTEHRMFPIPIATKKENEFKKAYFNNIEIIDLNSTGSSASISNSKHITGSKWVLDSRQTFEQKPVDIVDSFFNDGDSFLAARDQGTRGEGILQNDFSIFGLGYNGLRGRAPFAPLYNRRIPQAYGSNVYLAGEAKFESADNTVGPFYNDYNTYAKETRLIGQNYSIIPEFRISQFIEDIYQNQFSEESLRRDDFLQLTGAVYHSSSGDLSIGTQFFKTYSTSDFMKYFGDARKNVKENNFGFTEGRLTLKCAGVKRFLPYRGLYPAERLVQISEIFHRGYLNENSYNHNYIVNSGISEPLANNYLNLRIENSKAQALKPLMAPGVLFNSIKAGLAVDYPIFSSSLGSAIDHITGSFITSSLNDFSVLNLGAKTAFTGSLLNSTLDSGIPRISGSVSRRVDFEDVLEPERLFREVMYDNEPHPSASLLYGPAKLTKVLERPSKFGILDQTATKRDIAVNFGIQGLSFADSMLAYKSAVNNFCAETVNFFLEDQKLQTILSEPVKPYMQKDVNYKMRIYINNEQISMYDRHSAFGPPVDEGDVEITRFSLRDTTIQGVAATGSVSFGSYTGTESNMLGNTITVKDTANNGITYQFVTNSIPVTATGSIDGLVSSNLVNTSQEIGAQITIPNFSGGSNKTYQFVRDVTAATATGSVDFTGLTNSSVSSSTITLPDFDANNTKTYEFVNSTPATAATASINFAGTARTSLAEDILGITSSAGTDAEFQFKQEQIGQTASCIIDINSEAGTNASVFEQIGDVVGLDDYAFVDNDTLVLLPAGSSSADVYLDLPLRNFKYTQGNTNNTTGSARQIVFLNPTDYSLARYKIAFRSGKEPFNVLLESVLSGSVINSTASLRFVAEDLEQSFHFYTTDNSQYTGGAPEINASSYKVDVHDKTANQILEIVKSVLNTETATSDSSGFRTGIGKYLFAIGGSFNNDNENILNVFARRRSHALVELLHSQSELYFIKASSSQANPYFAAWPHPNSETIPTTASMDSVFLCQITTGSGNNRNGAWSQGSKFVTDTYEAQAREYMNDAGFSGTSFREQSQYKWSTYVQRVNANLPTDSGTAKPFRFITASYTGFTPSSLSFQFEDHIINSFSGSYGDNLSGSSFGNKEFTLNFIETGSAFNQVPNNTSSIGPSALGSNKIISTTGHQHFFLGGQNEIDFTAGQLVDGKRIIPIPQSATISQIVQSVSSSFNVIFDQEMGVFIRGSGDLLTLTQSASDGIGGNTTIHQSGFIVGDLDDGEISQAPGYLGFAGGTNAVSYTNGQTFGGSNIAVEVSSQASVSALRSRFQSAIESAQSGEFTFSNSSNKLVISMATTNTATAASRTITEGGSAFNSKVVGFSSGVNNLDFTTGDRLDQATGWSNYFGSDTNTNIAIVVGTKSTSANGSTSDSTSNIASLLSGSIAVNQNITSSVFSGLVRLTQSAPGTDGNQTITRTNISSSNYSNSNLNGFIGGYNALYHTNGSEIGGGNTNKAVLIGDSTQSGISGSTVIRDNFRSAIISNQNSTILAQSTSDVSLGPVPNVTLTQRVSGAAGNRTITDSGFSTIDNDVRGFAGGVDFVEGTIKMAPSTLIESSSHGYLPYVPPFLDPNTRPYVELSMIPAESKNYTIPEIIENLTSSYYNISAPSNADTNTNYKESMALSASLNFKNYVKLQSDNLVSIGGVLQPSDPSTSDKYRWVIQPKWETPILDFSHVTASALDLSSDSVIQVTGSPWKPRSQSNYYEILNISSKPYLTGSTGMWHQSGNILSKEESKGYHIVIEPSNHDLDSNVGDLASTCGFMDREERRRILSGYNNYNSYKLGKLAETKKISEAVVAIPYFLTDDCEMQFFPLRFSSLDDARQLNTSNENRLQTEIYTANTSEEVEIAKEKYEDWKNTPGQDAAANIAYQLRMMDKYVIPPHFDFEKFPSLVEPHVAYYFQFQAELTQKDLANIWQNMYPSSGSAGRAMKSETKSDDKSTDVQYISGYLNTDQISMFASRTSNYQHPEEFLEKEVRWLVFKVKRRAETFYKDLASRSITDNKLDIVSINDMNVNSIKSSKNSDAEFREVFGKFGYNWPYDFFSIVELIKVDSKVDFYENGEGETVTSILRQEQAQQTSEPQIFTRIEDGAGAATTTTSAFTATSQGGTFSSADVASSMVIREVLKADTAALPTPANRYTATTSTIRANTEQLYINGVLMSHGASNDYTISGNVITFTFNPNSNDSIVVTYIKG